MTAHKNDNKPWENLVTDELVKRLRDWPRQGATKSTNLLGDAADRIEALTAERDVAIKWWGESTELTRQARLQYSEEKARAEAAEAESDRLREALAMIDAIDPEHRIDGCAQTVVRGLVLRMGEIARAALNGETP